MWGNITPVVCPLISDLRPPTSDFYLLSSVFRLLSSFLSLLPPASCQLHFPCVLYLPLIVIKSSAKTHRGMTHGNTESQKLS